MYKKQSCGHMPAASQRMREHVVHSKCEYDECFQFFGSLMLFTVEKEGEGGTHGKGGQRASRLRECGSEEVLKVIARGCMHYTAPHHVPRGEAPPSMCGRSSTPPSASLGKLPSVETRVPLTIVLYTQPLYAPWDILCGGMVNIRTMLDACIAKMS
jgi:hypothetical protein